MKREIIISGFGGQGGLAIGKNLAEAGMAEGLNVTWAPSYGPEMRGGTANCSVVLSDKPVGSPVFAHPTELIALNEPSLVKFEAGVVPGGTGVRQQRRGHRQGHPSGPDRLLHPLPKIAEEVGNPKVSQHGDAGRLRGRHHGELEAPRPSRRCRCRCSPAPRPSWSP